MEPPVIVLWRRKIGHSEEDNTMKIFASKAQLAEFIEGWGPGSLRSLMKHNKARENYEACAVIRDEMTRQGIE